MWKAEEHTADALLVVEARSWSRLLEEAVVAFSSWLLDTEPPTVLAEEERELRVEGVDATATWVRFWRGLHRLWVVEGLLAVAAEVDPGAEQTAVTARVRCVASTELSTEPAEDVKAVTWHQADVSRSEDGTWRGTIVLDI